MCFIDKKTGKKVWLPPKRHFQPNPQRYKSNAARQRAYRKRKKQRHGAQ
jgi:hypothetical protein